MDHGIRLTTVTLSAPEPRALATFYARLLGWAVTTEEPDWVVITGPESVAIGFHLDDTYEPPVWPSEPGKPQMQMHLEIRVTDLPGALRHALECGARLAEHQPQDDVRVCLDPIGHPFCLWLDSTEEDLSDGLVA